MLVYFLYLNRTRSLSTHKNGELRTAETHSQQLVAHKSDADDSTCHKTCSGCWGAQSMHPLSVELMFNNEKRAAPMEHQPAINAFCTQHYADASEEVLLGLPWPATCGGQGSYLDQKLNRALTPWRSFMRNTVNRRNLWYSGKTILM